MNLIKLKTIFWVSMAVCSFQLTAQEFYVNKIWETESATLGGENHAASVLDANGNVLSVCNKKNSNAANIFSNKLNSIGNQTWQSELNNSMNVSGTENHGTDIKKDASGNTFICGANFNGSNYDYLIVKYNSSGVELWRKTYNGTGNGDDIPSSLVLDASGNVYVTGASNGLLSQSDFLTLKLNGSNGAILWNARYNFANSYDFATQIKLDNQGKVLVCGASAQNLFNADILVIKYNPANGNQMLIKRHDSPQYGYDIPAGMEIDANNTIYVLGTANANLVNKDIKLLSFNSSNLNVNWVKYFDESGVQDQAFGLTKDNTGKLLITGSAKNAQNQTKMITAKINQANGALIWKKYQENVDGIIESVGKKIKADLSGNIIAVGEVVVNGVSHIKTISYDPTGEKRWEYVNENISMTNQKILDVLVKDSEVILTGTKENTTGETLITVKLEGKEIFLAPDFYGEPPSISHAFELNKGQLSDTEGNVADMVQLYTQHTYPQIFLGKDFNSFLWSRVDDDSLSIDTLHRVDLDFLSSQQFSEPILKFEELKSHNNYYLANNPNGIINNKSYSRAVRQNIYKGVDLQFYSNDNGLKLYFVVYPDGNASTIRFKFTGGAVVETTPSGGMIITSVLGDMEYKKALVYNIDNNGNNVLMPASGTIMQYGNELAFDIANYDHSRILVIQLEKEEPTRDESDIEWSTFFSGTNSDKINDITSGSDERFYITGEARAANFPIFGPNVYDGSYGAGGVDAFFSQFNNQYELEYSTFIGGQAGDYGLGVGHDDLNNVTYVVGASGSNATTLPTMPFSQNPTGYNDQFTNGDADPNNFIARFNSVGALTWLSFLPGTNTFASVKVDNTGNVYCARRISQLVGQESSYSFNALPNGGFPLCRTNPNAYLQDFSGTALFASNPDIAIMKFSPTLDLTWSTYFGGEHFEYFGDIEVDENYVYIVGSSNSESCLDCYTDNATKNIPVKENVGYFQENADNIDGFIAKFTLDGELVYSSFFGGEQADYITDAALFNGKLIIGGYTYTNYYHNVEGVSSDGGGFPKKSPTSGIIQGSFGGGSSDNFVAEFRVPEVLVWSTFSGGAGNENTMKVDVNEQGYVYVAGETTSGSNSANGTISPIFNSSFYSNDTHSDYTASSDLAGDLYAKGFDGNRSNFWTTYFGSKLAGMNDIIGGIQTIKEKVYITGQVGSQTNFPYKCPATTNPYCQPDYIGGGDAFLAQLKLGTDFYYAGLTEEYAYNQENIKIFPNPTNDIFILQTDQNYSTIKNIEIKNQLGQIVKTINNPKKSDQNSYEINISDLIHGIYFVTLSMDEQIGATVKIVKN